MPYKFSIANTAPTASVIYSTERSTLRNIMYLSYKLAVSGLKSRVTEETLVEMQRNQ